MPRRQVGIPERSLNIPMTKDLLDGHQVYPCHDPARGGGMPQSMPTNALNAQPLQRRRKYVIEEALRAAMLQGILRARKDPRRMSEGVQGPKNIP